MEWLPYLKRQKKVFSRNILYDSYLVALEVILLCFL